MSRRQVRYTLGLGITGVVALVAALLVTQPWDGGDGGTALDTVAGRDVREAAASPASELSGLLATTDLGVGTNRVSFLLQSPKALITYPEASVTSLYLPADGSPAVVKERATATFHLWPFGTRGNYETQFTFDRPGSWALDVRVQDGDQLAGVTRIPLEVREASITPAIGARPPMVPNKTIADVGSFEELTSWLRPDPDLYLQTIPEAVARPRPLLVVFSSPAFCTSPTCGPQVDTVSEVKERHRNQTDFIHVEVYDNPHEVQGNLDNARYSPVVEAWGLTDIEGYLNESWTFVLDGEGLITAKFEGFATAEELEEALLQASRPQSS